MTRMPAPALEPSNPPCSLCYRETVFDGDCYYCENCEAYWDTAYEFIEWYSESDEESEQCDYSEQFGELRYQCLLTAGHASAHQIRFVEE